VLESADEYQEIQDLLLRHATLQATNDDLRAHQQHSAAEAEEIRVALQAFTKQKMDEILNLNNKLSQLKKQLENYEQQAAQQVRLGTGATLCLASTYTRRASAVTATRFL
jgi:hypothetical protein